MTTNFVDDLSARRGTPRVGANSLQLGIERVGGRMVQVIAFEPDPVTFRDDYYYNAQTNALYKKVIVSERDGMVVAFWQQASG